MKKLFAFLLITVLMFSVTLTAFAQESISNITADEDSLEYAVARAVGNGVEFNSVSDSSYPYDVQISYRGQSTTIYLKERPTVDNIDIKMNQDGSLNISGIGTGDSNQWNNLFMKFRGLITAISGIATFIMIGVLIVLFTKLSTTAGNPQARAQVIVGIVIAGVAFALLGSVAVISGFFYNAF